MERRIRGRADKNLPDGPVRTMAPHDNGSAGAAIGEPTESARPAIQSSEHHPMDDAERTWRDRALRDSVLAGDESAWRVLYDRAYAPLLAYVRCRVAGDAVRTDEVVQETWLVAVRRIGRFDPGRGSFEAWLVGIAQNVLRNERRRMARQRAEVATDAADVAELASESVRPDEAIVRARVSLTFASLSSSHRAVLRAKYAERRSVDAIASAIGRSPKAVESLLSRARAAFRATFRALEKADAVDEPQQRNLDEER